MQRTSSYMKTGVKSPVRLANANFLHNKIKIFHQDNKQQFGEIKDEISKTKLRLDDAWEQISNTGERM